VSAPRIELFIDELVLDGFGEQPGLREEVERELASLMAASPAPARDLTLGHVDGGVLEANAPLPAAVATAVHGALARTLGGDK
jgi:hypothetical protein